MDPDGNIIYLVNELVDDRSSCYKRKPGETDRQTEALLFYGWVIVGISFRHVLAELCGIPSLCSTFPFWRICWSAQLLLLYFLLTSWSMPSALRVGGLLDRYGPRVLFRLGCSDSLGLFMSSFFTSIWQLYFTFGSQRTRDVFIWFHRTWPLSPTGLFAGRDGHGLR